MLYLTSIHWRRRVAAEGRPLTGKSTYTAIGRSYAAAEKAAKTKFMRKYGAHSEISRVEEYADPAGLFKGSVDVPPASSATVTDCGAPHPYGVCPACGKAHGYTILSR